MPALRSRHFWLQPARFLLSGGMATALHWLLMTALIAVPVPAVLATALGAIAGACLNYLLQYHFTFRARTDHAKAVPVYFLVAALGWLANLGLFAGLHLLLDLNIAIAQVLTTGIVALLNYVLYKRVVFHECSQSPLAT